MTMFPPPLEDRSPLPWWFLPCFHAFLVVSVAFSPGPFRTAVTLPLATFFIWKYGQYDAGSHFSDRYATGSLVVAELLNYIDLILLSNADKERWRPLKSALPSTKAPVEEPKVPESFKSRLQWSLNITSVYLRGFGWTHEAKNIGPPPPVGTSRWKYVLQQTLKVALAVLLLDTCMAFVVRTQGTSAETWDFYDLPLWQQRLLSLSSIPWTWAAFEIRACGIYAVIVALGLYRPEDCPQAWGRWSESYTVRNLWGKAWHQFLRRTATMAGDLVARDALRLRKGSWLSKYTKLFAGFFVSGLIHYGGAVFGCGHDTGDLSFFMVQAAFIMLEDHIIDAGRKLGFRDGRGWRAVGYVWTWAWVVISWRWFIGPKLTGGLGTASQPLDVFGLIPKPSLGGMDAVEAIANGSSLWKPMAQR